MGYSSPCCACRCHGREAGSYHPRTGKGMMIMGWLLLGVGVAVGGLGFYQLQLAHPDIHHVGELVHYGNTSLFVGVLTAVLGFLLNGIGRLRHWWYWE